MKQKFKKNPVEKALNDKNSDTPAACQNFEHMAPFCEFLGREYNITDIQPIVGIVCNTFFVARVANTEPIARLFIKTGRHAGLYQNEYEMGKALYDIDQVHFIKPLFYNDHSQFNFFANEYVKADSLTTFMLQHNPTTAQRHRLVRDLYQIFLALKQSDVVHRDIRPDNFMIRRGRLVLIDFQLAVSKSNYTELEYMRKNPRRLRNLGGKTFRYKPFVWDDAYSLLKVLKFIGRDRAYGAEYDKIYREIKSHIGHDRIKTAVREGGMRRALRHIKRTWDAI